MNAAQISDAGGQIRLAPYLLGVREIRIHAADAPALVPR
jgi:hypothetical protein